MDLGTNYLCYKTNTCVSQKKQIISDLAEKWRREQLKMFGGGGVAISAQKNGHITK